MSKEVLLFDCDGLLVDSEPLKWESWQEVLGRYDATLTEAEYAPLVGITGREIMRMLRKTYPNLPDTVLEERWEWYHERQRDQVKPFPEALEFIRRQTATLGLVSGGRRREVATNLEILGLEQAFDVVVAGLEDLVGYGDPQEVNKPYPFIYLYAAKRLGVLPEECLVFEDTWAGVAAAKDAGMEVIAVPNRLTEGHDFSRADRVIHRWNELSQSIDTTGV